MGTTTIDIGAEQGDPHFLATEHDRALDLLQDKVVVIGVVIFLTLDQAVFLAPD